MNPGKNSSRYSSWARLNPEKAREKDSRNRHRRRARLHNGYSEPYSASGIFNRDNWICQICYLPVDPQETNKLMRASIDHIIMICWGGDDTPENVRLTHLRCNLKRPRIPSKSL